MKKTAANFLSWVILFCYSQLVMAENTAIDDRAALADLKVGKAVFLVDIGDAKKLNFYLEVIQWSLQGYCQDVRIPGRAVYLPPGSAGGLDCW